MLRELIAVYGLPLVFANVLLESLGLPLPALPTLILTGGNRDRDRRGRRC
jgi:membrane protein DedA with SNARE-associated domain